MWARVGLLCLTLSTFGCATGPERPKPQALPAQVSYAGTWDSTWGKMELMQDGTHVHGDFTGYRSGGLTGSVDGNLYRFLWTQLHPESHGHGWMQMSPDGSHLEGRWGYLEDDSNGGRWAADRNTSGY